MPCRTHSHSIDEGHCPICLLEAALAPPGPGSDGWVWADEHDATAAARRLSVLVPLGATSVGAVYLVRQHAPVGALLRLKTWRQAAPADFLARFERLQQDMARASEPALVEPLAAWLDAAGHPYVLSDFRRGVPLNQAVRSDAVTADAASRVAGSLAETLRRLHGLGLAHGSIVPGNVMVHSDGWFLVDFGVPALLGSAPDLTELVARDLEGLSAIAVTSRPGS
jgi:serine/threonine protein kinase